MNKERLIKLLRLVQNRIIEGRQIQLDYLHVNYFTFVADRCFTWYGC